MVHVRRRRRVWPWVLLVVLLAPLVAAALAVERAPRAVPPAAPVAADAVLARDLAGRLRELIETEGAAGRFGFTEAEADAAARSAARLIEGLDADVSLDPEGATLMASLGAPVLPAGLWLNLSGTLAASEQGLAVTDLRLGRLPLPAGPVLAALRLAADRMITPGTARLAQDAVGAVRIDPPQALVLLDFAPGAREELFGRLRAQTRALGGGIDRERIGGHLDWLHDAVRTGAAEEAGSVVPRIRGVLARAAADGGGPDGLKAAFYALGLYCGSENLKVAIGMGMPVRMEGRRSTCKQKVTLGGRDDLKRHFLLSAALQAATTGTATQGLGEMKELLDSALGGTGFSFDDMAANRAGSQLAEAFLAAPPADWPAMAARITAEADILPEVSDLPSRMTEAEFVARFGAVDSLAYTAMIAEIDRRIDALPFHRAPD